MSWLIAAIAVSSAMLAGAAQAATFTVAGDPFAGSTALTTPGRQVVGGEPSITFNPATDQFVVALADFGLVGLVFANDVAADLATGGLTVIVLRDFDNDANPATGFGAGTAANLIADRISTPGAGFFLYFNSMLDLPRLVFSTDLSDNTADLRIIARLTNLGGQTGRDAFANFTPANFTVTPVPSALALFAAPLIAGAWRLNRKKRYTKLR